MPNSLQPDLASLLSSFHSIEPSSVLVKRIESAGIIVNEPVWLYFIWINSAIATHNIFNFYDGRSCSGELRLSVSGSAHLSRRIVFNAPVFFSKAIYVYYTFWTNTVSIGYVLKRRS